jgi:hypothetical protein
MTAPAIRIKPGVTIRPGVTLSGVQRTGGSPVYGLSSGSYHFKIDVSGAITKNDFWFGTPPTLNTASMVQNFGDNYDDQSFEVDAVSNGGFPVNFLGTTYSTFWVSGNGAVSFGAPNDLRQGGDPSGATENNVPCLYMNNNDACLLEIWYTVLGGSTLAYKIRGNTNYDNSGVNYEYDIYFYPMGYIDVIVNQEPTSWNAYNDGQGNVKWGVTDGTNWIDGLSNHQSSIGYTP